MMRYVHRILSEYDKWVLSMAKIKNLIDSLQSMVHYKAVELCTLEVHIQVIITDSTLMEIKCNDDVLMTGAMAKGLLE